MGEHQPVLLQETMQALQLRSRGCYLDATYGRGGHAAAILERLQGDGRLIVMDRDPEAIACARARLSGDQRVSIVHEAFSNLAAVAAQHDVLGKLDGVLLDVGVSSPQLDSAGRGFSFMHDGPLDMRMDPSRGESAAQWLARADAADIAGVIRRFGEQREPRRVARAIVAARTETPIESTAQLAAIVAGAVRARETGKHPATRVFQAIRIHINNELGELESALEASVEVLAPGGRLCVISFHSLEDRMVKRFMRRHALADPVWRGLPDIPPDAQPRLARPARAVRASAEEVAANPRSRSAVLRCAEKVR